MRGKGDMPVCLSKLWLRGVLLIGVWQVQEQTDRIERYYSFRGL